MSDFSDCLSVGMRRGFVLNHGRSSCSDVALGCAPLWSLTGIEVNAVYFGGGFGSGLGFGLVRCVRMEMMQGW